MLLSWPVSLSFIYFLYQIIKVDYISFILPWTVGYAVSRRENVDSTLQPFMEEQF